jgi:hypothetical protein
MTEVLNRHVPVGVCQTTVISLQLKGSEDWYGETEGGSGVW